MQFFSIYEAIKSKLGGDYSFFKKHALKQQNMMFRKTLVVADDPYLAVGLLAIALLDGKDSGPCFCPFLPLLELPVVGDFGGANLTGVLAGDGLGLGESSLVVSSLNFTLN